MEFQDEDDTSTFDALQSDQGEKAATWGSAFESVMDALNLQSDWDGMGADAPDKRILNVWLDLMRELRNNDWRPPSHVRPTPDGCIALEWELPAYGYRVEAELTADEVHWTTFDL
jgi:hypothetical protein